MLISCIKPPAPAMAQTPREQQPPMETPLEATVTYREQARVEKLVAQSYAATAQIVASLQPAAGAAPPAAAEQAEEDPFAFAESVPLTREEHIAYCRAGLERLPKQMSSLDASRPWLCYWMSHSLELLGSPVDTRCAARLTDFLGTRCQDRDGGFAGGPGQLPHLAPTYAAINTLVTLGTPEAYACVRRPELYAFLLRLKNEDGSFSVHEGGESDVRGTYTAVSVASQTGIASDALFSGTAEWLASCQTYEGGMGGESGNEAHGGYTFCGVAALALLGKVELLDQPRLLRWLAGRQLPYEGGFQGRTQKVCPSATRAARRTDHVAFVRDPLSSSCCACLRSWWTRATASGKRRCHRLSRHPSAQVAQPTLRQSGTIERGFSNGCSAAVKIREAVSRTNRCASVKRIRTAKPAEPTAHTTAPMPHGEHASRPVAQR